MVASSSEEDPAAPVPATVANTHVLGCFIEVATTLLRALGRVFSRVAYCASKVGMQQHSLLLYSNMLDLCIQQTGLALLCSRKLQASISGTRPSNPRHPCVALKSVRHCGRYLYATVEANLPGDGAEPVATLVSATRRRVESVSVAHLAASEAGPSTNTHARATRSRHHLKVDISFDIYRLLFFREARSWMGLQLRVLSGKWEAVVSLRRAAVGWPPGFPSSVPSWTHTAQQCRTAQVAADAAQQWT
jgi:hypothetical protein